MWREKKDFEPERVCIMRKWSQKIERENGMTKWRKKVD